ncbi:MAG: cytochrome P450 [Hyphomicrobiales bacterium]
MAAFNPADPAFLENPFPFYEVGQKMSPLYFDTPDGGGIWSAFRYEECVSILRDHQSWSSYSPPPPDMTDVPEPSMLGADPPRHTRLRGLVSQAFTPRMIEQLEPRIYEVANQLIDAIADKREADIVDALTYPLPVIMIAEILGIPTEDRADFRRWSDEIVATLGTGLNGEDAPLSEQTQREIRDYFTKMVEERRAKPRNDLISGLVAAELEGSKLNFEELMQMLILLLVAGNETTTNLIGNAIQEFIAHPDQLRRVLDNRAILPSAIEEVLRYSSPVQATVRRATRDLEIGGKTIKKDQQTLVWLASANRDEAVFCEPTRFDVTRTPNRHLSFGLGIHFCLGAPLARMEARVALDVFLKRIRNFERVDSNPLPRVPTFIMRGVRELPIRYEVVA